MRFFSRLFSRRALAPAAFVSAALLVPAAAHAQYSAPDSGSAAIGEKYHVEVAGTLWMPSLFGVISSEQFGIIGDEIDFVNDLGFKRTRFGDLRIVLRPSQKHRFRIQYTPVVYEAETTLNRTVIFNGLTYPVSLPIQSSFGWKVWRLGYEYDFFYTPRGFAGVLLEARMTEFSAELNSVIARESTIARGPLPAIGGVGRFYIIPEVARPANGKNMPGNEAEPAGEVKWEILETRPI